MAIVAAFLLVLAAACAVGFSAAGRDWRGWQDPAHPGRMPLAESPATWFMVAVLLGPIAWIGYALDRRYAPLR